MDSAPHSAAYAAVNPAVATAGRGLTSAEAAERLAEFGANDPTPNQERSQWLELGAQFANPLVAILLFACVVSAFVGEWVNAAIIVGIVVLSVTINFTQTFRSKRAASKLRLVVAPTATALRDGSFCEIPRGELVPGDVVRLSAGDLVPADARLLAARDLHVQESALTGESLPVEKNVRRALHDTDASPPPASDDDDDHDMVRLGTSVVSGTATACIVATGTRTMFGDIAKRLRAKPPETAFDRGLRQFGALIMKTVFALVLLIPVFRIGTHRGAFESLLFAIALAVGLTPEFLPLITSVTLSKGAVEMAKRKVVVKHLSAIQNLGSIDILCSDKTGTLTRGRMTFETSLDPWGAPSDEALFYARINSQFETGIKSPLDVALLEQMENPAPNTAIKIDEIPFDFERRRSTIVADVGGKRLLITKGAPEAVLSCCERAGAHTSTLLPIDDTSRSACNETHRRLAARGLRVLAVAVAEVATKESYAVADEQRLSLIGYVAFADPPLSDAAEALAALGRDGVAVKILTGDSEIVTRYVCAEVGLDVEKVVLGSDIDAMNDWALAHVAEETSVFARMSPAQKSRVIAALKQRSHVVGYHGDGINDAPSLHTADVGISVASAVDVARDAADIILLEQSLSVLHRGILEGRRAFGNVDKYLLMGTSSNFGNMFSMAAASVFLSFLPMLPTQILLNNLMYDVAQLTIPSDRVDDEVVARPQRFDVRTLRNFMLVIGPVSSIFDFATFAVLLRYFHASEALFHTGWFVESLATQTLVLFVIRTPQSTFRSRPSAPLVFTTVSMVLLAMVLPFTPVAGALGFTPLPLAFFVYLTAATALYLGLVELVKRRLLHRHRQPAVDARSESSRSLPPLDQRDGRPLSN